MSRRTYLESSIDFDKLDANLSALEPPRLELEDVLARIRPRLEAMRSKGIRPEQMAEALERSGIRVNPRRIENYLQHGELDPPAKRKPRPAATKADDQATPEAPRQHILPVSGPGPS